MQVFVSGATGVLGKRAVGQLADRGHDVTGLVRDDADAELVANRGGSPIRGDVPDPDTLGTDQPVDAVVHAATALPTAMKPSEDDWARNDRFREAVGWEPSYPTYREGLAQVIETWLADGTITRTAQGYEWVG